MRRAVSVARLGGGRVDQKTVRVHMYDRYVGVRAAKIGEKSKGMGLPLTFIEIIQFLL